MQMNRLQQTFEVSRSSHRTIYAMEGLRGLAVFLVFLVHYSGLVAPWLPKSSTTFQLSSYLNYIGNIGVDLFFVLSGYLIYGSLIKKQAPFGSYLYRRIQRIYPTFLFVLAVYLILSLIFPSENKFPADWLGSAIYLLQNLLLLPGIFNIDPIITVSWSLSYELFYYFTIPLLIAIFSLRKWRWQLRAVFFALVSALGFTYCYLYGGHVRLLMFVAGIILFELLSSAQLKLPRFSGLIAFAVVVVAPIWTFATGIADWWHYLALYFLFLVFCWECLGTDSGSAKIFVFTPLRWFGNISYSYYLIHGLTLKAAFLLLQIFLPPSGTNAAMFWVAIAPMFVLTLVSSIALFIFVEKPFSLTFDNKQKEKTEFTPQVILPQQESA